ncbi:MAG TPA: metallophosphoesterase [Elusimicrobiales bacterium]|nr:metallophosphoesterase [Elusimicrobiales bacterium]
MKRLFPILLAIAGPAFFCSPARPAEDSCSRCIVVYGDTRTNHDVHKKITELITARKPEAVFHVGDMVSDGREAKDWAKFAEITADLRGKTRFYPVRGNHEQLAPGYFTFFGLEDWTPWYSADLRGIHFIVLDSETPFWKGTAQYKWLLKDLKAAAASPENKYIVALLHRPVYSTSEHGTNDLPVVAEALVPLFEQYAVDAVFSGHDHDYERSYKDGIYYVVTGSGGAPLYEQKSTSTVSQVFAKKYHYLALSVEPGGLKAEVFDDSDALIDSFEMKANARKIK